MTDDFNPISVDPEHSDIDNDLIDNDFNTEIGTAPQLELSNDGELPIAIESSEEKGSAFKPILQNLRRVFFPTREERSKHLARRIGRLSSAVELYPDSPTNYALRGELYLETGDYVLAIDDFRRALDLAMTQVEGEDWGIVAQTIQDRAKDGLARAERYTL